MSGVQTHASDVDVDLGQLFAGLARRWQRILAVALIVTGCALAFAWMATPHYKGETRLLIETRESVFTRPDSNGENERPILDEEGVTSQVEVILSTDLLKQVALKLNLARLPEFDEAADLSLISRALIVAGLKNDPNEVPPEERVLKAFREKLQVYRVERSRVIVVEFSSEDPKLAADVPNALADAYIAVQSDAKKQSNSAATDWLGPEIEDLTAKVKEAESRVAIFRGESDLLIGQNNAVLATQQLSELSTELSRVRASRAAAQASADSVRGILANGGSLDALPEVLSSGLIQRLRERQVQLKADIADLSTSLLDNHPRIRGLRSQLNDLDGQIRVEADKILRGLGAEARTAQLREQELIADLNRLKAESARAGEQEVELRALEREATAQRELLESYLTRYHEAASRRDRDYLPADARIFSRAIMPAEPYFPKVLPIAGAAFVASLLVMALVTLVGELFSGRAMRQSPGAQHLVPIAEVAMPETRMEDEDAVVDDETQEPAGIVETVAEEPRPMPEAANAPVAPMPAPQPVRSKLGEIGIERAAEKLIADGVSRALFVSPEGDEAAASAVLVAREVADAGLRVLLLDLTATGAASRPMLDSITYPGITNLLASEAQFTEVIHTDHYSDCHVIPVGTANPARAMRAADRLPIIMDSLTTAYDVVVVECGPADAASIRRLVADGTEVLVSVIEPDDAIAAVAAELKAGGYEELTLVTPAGYAAPNPPVPGRSAA